MRKSSDLIKTATNQVGLKEKPANSNNIIFNTEYYGKPVTGSRYPWCMTFVWWCFKHSSMSDLFYDGNKTASCTTLMKWAKLNKRFVPVEKLRSGDIVFYNFDKDSDAEHTGICIDNSGHTISAIEGNTSLSNNSNGGEVMTRVRSYSQVLGGYRPAYDEERYEGVFPEVTIRRGSKGIQVELLQCFLNWYNPYNKLEVDGKCGPKTTQAIKDFQRAEKLEVDGSCGPKTRRAMRCLIR